MTYKIRVTKTQTVSTEEYIIAATKIVLDGLEKLEALKGNDVTKAAGAIDEISEYVESIQETIGDLEPEEDDSPYAKNAVEENDEHKTLCAKFLNKG